MSGQLKHWLVRNDSGTWGEEPTGLSDVEVLRSTDIALDGSWSIEDPAVRSVRDSERRRKTLAVDDLVVVTSSGSEAHLGKTAIVTGEVASRGAVFANFVQRLTVGITADPRFVRYFLTSKVASDEMASLSNTTTGLRNLNGGIIDALTFPGPPVAEQRAIADYLDAETARIDALITKKKQMEKLLGEYEDALIDELFGPGGGQRFTRLARIARVRSGVTLNSNRTSNESDVSRPYLRVANVQPGYLALGDVKTVRVPLALAERCSLRPGDVLMTEGGDIDKLGRGTVWRGEIPDCLHQNHVFAVRPRSDRLYGQYLAHLTRTSHARAYFESTGVQSTNLASTNSSKVGDFPVPALDLDEQRLAVDEFAARAIVIRSCLSALHDQTALLSERRRALVTAAVTGEFRVPGAA